MMTAFVLSGDANLGAVQVGMLQALHEAGNRPDLLIGTSVGAINAAWRAGPSLMRAWMSWPTFGDRYDEATSSRCDSGRVSRAFSASARV